MPDQIDGVSISHIGTIESAGLGPRVALSLPDGNTIDLSDHGWEHGR